MKKRKRRYVQRARREKLAETRTRIVDAIMHLHQEVGPRATTVSAIAQRAGVERLTVYRHFRDPVEMFAACSNRFLQLNPPPLPESGAVDADPRQRVAASLSALYTYFRGTARMFEKIYRDVGDYPELGKILSGFDAYLRDQADALATACHRGAERERCRTILRHAVKFSTWQSFEADAVPDSRKIALLLDWLLRS